jgi:diadenosine tetraphosphate (Ap4A) HIT family hydrolase
MTGLLAGVLAFATLTTNAVAQLPSCTPLPNIYGAWKQATSPSDTSESAVRKCVNGERARVSGLPDPFTPIASMDSAHRVAKGEQVLWEDATVMVLVAIPPSPGHVLVIPKTPVMFLSDAPERVRHHLALVAAATSDAMMLAAGSTCAGWLPPRISVSPPSGLIARQLHVHVVPTEPISSNDLEHIYTEASGRIGGLVRAREAGAPSP